MGHVEIPLGIQGDSVGLIVNLPFAFMGQIDQDLGLTQLARSGDGKTEDPIPPALGDNQHLAAWANHNSIRKCQPLRHRVADSLAVEEMDRTVGVLLV